MLCEANARLDKKPDGHSCGCVLRGLVGPLHGVVGILLGRCVQWVCDLRVQHSQARSEDRHAQHAAALQRDQPFATHVRGLVVIPDERPRRVDQRLSSRAALEQISRASDWPDASGCEDPSRSWEADAVGPQPSHVEHDAERCRSSTGQPNELKH